MSWDCIAFAENEAPELLQVREDQQDVSFIIKGQWQTRRVGTFSVTSPGKETVYLIAHGLDNRPSDSIINDSIKKLNPRPYK